MSDRDGGVDDSSLFETAEGRLRLLFDHDRNQQLLADWLAQSYAVETPAESALDETTDLCLVDEAAFASHQEELQTWKRRSDPVFAPVLLVSEQPVSERFDPDEWQTIDGLYVVDDVIATPIEKPVLHRRLENLLERRTLSKTLDLKYRQSEQRFSSLFTTLPDPAFVTDSDGTLRIVNDAFSEWCGVDPDSVVGQPLSSLECMGQSAVEDIESNIERAIGGDPPEAVEVELTTTNGQSRHAELNATATAIDGSQFVTAVLRDVTERVTKTASLAESEERFRQISTHLNEVIWMADAGGELLYLSPGYETLTGRAIESVTDDLLSAAVEHVHPEDSDRIAEEFRTLAEDLQSGDCRDEYHFEYRLLHEDGSVHWIENDAYPIVAQESTTTRVVGLIDDITDRKRRERELRRQNERLDEFAGLISHDLRNPLQIVNARTELLADETGDPADHMEAIRNASDRMQRLIEDLLALAREGESASDVEPVELAAVAERAWESIDAPAVTLRIEGDAMIEADASRLRQLLENLFRNAVEHGSESDQRDDDGDGENSSRGLTVRVGTLDGGFYVADDGRGIPADRREQIFERGFTTQSDGTGFGLNIVDEIATAHDWTVTVTESEGGGARFEFVGTETYAH